MRLTYEFMRTQDKNLGSERFFALVLDRNIYIPTMNNEYEKDSEY